MKDLVEKVVEWGRERGLDKAGHLAQAKYTLKETAELLDAYADGDKDKMNDAIGDILVTLIVGASNDEDMFIRTGFEYIENVKEDNSNTNKFQLSNMTSVALNLIVSCKRGVVHSLDYGIAVRKLNDVLMMINQDFKQSLSLKDCLQLAYDEIKNRKGKLVNGQFIKEEK